MVKVEKSIRLDALPAEELAKLLFRERLVRTGLTFGAAYFLYNGFVAHDLMENAFQTVKAQGGNHYEPVYRFAQIGLWIGSLFGTGFFARFAHKAHRRVEELESTPSFTSTEKRTEPEVLGELKRVQ